MISSAVAIIPAKSHVARQESRVRKRLLHRPHRLIIHRMLSEYSAEPRRNRAEVPVEIKCNARKLFNASRARKHEILRARFSRLHFAARLYIYIYVRACVSRKRKPSGRLPKAHPRKRVLRRRVVSSENARPRENHRTASDFSGLFLPRHDSHDFLLYFRLFVRAVRAEKPGAA